LVGRIEVVAAARALQRAKQQQLFVVAVRIQRTSDLHANPTFPDDGDDDYDDDNNDAAAAHS
jgi:hypothetical protein